MSQTTAELVRRVKPPPDVVEKFSKARALVAALWPFMTTATLRLIPVWSPLVPTMAVDRWWRLYMNPTWVGRKRPDGKDVMSAREFSLLIVGHELQHLLQMHPSRLVKYRGRMILIDGQPVSLDNAANDLAINCNLDSCAKSALEYRNSVKNKRMDPIPVPTDILHPARFVDDRGVPFPVGMMSELYADLLDRTAKSNSKKKGKGESQVDEPDPNAPPHAGGPAKAEHGCGKCGSGGGGTPGEWEDPSEADPTDASTGVTVAEAEVIVRQTAQAAVEQEERARGTVPGGMLLWAEGYLAPAKVPWEKVVKQKLRGAVNWVNGQVDSTYMRRNRRVRPAPGTVIRPGYQRPLPKLVVVWDTSGSMHSSDHEMVMSELHAICRSSGLPAVPVIPCDAAASEVQWVRKVQEINLIGGGGTDMVVGIEAAVRCVPDARLIIVMSDGYTGWPLAPLAGVRVVACLTQRGGGEPPDWIDTVYACD